MSSGLVFVQNQYLTWKCSVFCSGHLFGGHGVDDRKHWSGSLWRSVPSWCFLDSGKLGSCCFLNGGQSWVVFEAHGAAAKINCKSSSEHPVLLVFSGGIGWVCFNSPLKKTYVSRPLSPGGQIDKIAAPFGCPTLQHRLRTATRLLAHQQWQRILESLKEEDGQMTALEVTGVLDLLCVFVGVLCIPFDRLSTVCYVSLFQKLGNALTWTLTCDLLCEDSWGKQLVLGRQKAQSSNPF